MKRLIAACALGLVPLSVTWIWNGTSLAAGTHEHSRSILELIEALDHAEPLRTNSLERLIGQKLTCSQSSLGSNGVRFDCDVSDLAVGDQVIGHLNFRQVPAGSILVIDHLGQQCVSVPALEEQFGYGILEQSCTDGVFCLYERVKRAWGKLSIEVPDAASQNCAKSVVLNSIQ